MRLHGPNGERGQVNMVIATPPDKHNRILTEPLCPRRCRAYARSHAAGRTHAGQRPQGMSLVTHEHHVQHTVDQLVNVTEGWRGDLLLDQVGALLGLHKTNWAIPMPTTFWRTPATYVVFPPPYTGGADVSRTNPT